MQPNYRSLAFLLSIGSLPLACTKDTNDTDGDDSTTTASTNPNATTGTGTDSTDPTQASEPTTTTGQTTTTMSPSDPTAASEPPPTSFVTSESESADTGFETEDTGIPPATDPTCIAYGAHLVECFPRYAGYQNYFAKDCEYSKMYAMVDGEACMQAVEAFYVCVSMADCAELDPEMPIGCQKEQTAVEVACPSFEGRDSDTDGGGGDTDTTG